MNLDLLTPPSIVDLIRRECRTARFRSAQPVMVQGANTNASDAGPIAFRRATGEKVSMLTPETFTIGAARIPISRKVDGNGYLYGVVCDIQAPTAANAAAVTFTEDAPWNTFDSVVLSDVAGELINVGGYDLFLANLGGKQYASLSPADSSRLFTLTPGGGALGGSMRMALRVPVGINRRSLTGIVGNQDRFTSYTLRTDIAASATIYTTAPTALPTNATMDKYYEYYTVPNAKSQGANPQDQEQYPPDYGRLHFITAGDSDQAPAPTSKRQHYLKRIGNTIRFIAIVLRAGVGTSPRALAEANLPTSILFKIGDDAIFTEQVRYRQWLMYERYGFDFPAGVLVYDVMHDLLDGAGSEAGDDYWYTQGLNNALFEMVYPAGFTAGGTLHFITDDLQEGAFSA